jgi:hypothetical protein
VNKIQTEPVLLAGTITGVIMAGLAMAVSLGWLNLNDGQMKSIETFVVGLLGLLVPIALAWWARQKVTPLAAPKTKQGEEAILMPASLVSPQMMQQIKEQEGN